jgi:hypothetical protein
MLKLSIERGLLAAVPKLETFHAEAKKQIGSQAAMKSVDESLLLVQ